MQFDSFFRHGTIYAYTKPLRMEISSPDNRGLVFVAYIPVEEIEKYKNNDVKKLRSRAIPKGNIQDIKYIVPMIKGEINGYYDVTSINISINNQNEPRIIFNLTDYHRLGEHNAIVQKGNMKILNYGGSPISLHKLISIYDSAPKIINFNNDSYGEEI